MNFEHPVESLFSNPEQDVASQFSVYEASDLVKGGNIVNQQSTKPVSGDSLRTVVDAKEWLPFAAEVYEISPKLSDYIIVPVEIIRSDIPNRNGIAFPMEELMRFHPPPNAIQAYRTWIGQPTHYEHQNNTVNKLAKGVIISVAIRKMENVMGDYIRLLHLLAFDRTKDPKLCQDILDRKRTGYSMGSSCETYTCPICNADMRNRGYCDHIDVRTKQSKSRMQIFGDKLAYCQSRGVRGFECSSVAIPAFHYAKNANILIE